MQVTINATVNEYQLAGILIRIIRKHKKGDNNAAYNLALKTAETALHTLVKFW